MRVLHTSDWHLGRSLFGQKRYEEFSAFLDWLARTLQEKEVDVLVVSGDIFDSGTPSNRAQRLYYDFLRQVYLSSCRHVVITAGNHDSPSMLGASREILQVLDVHVVGNLPEDPAEEIKVLRDAQGKVALIVCAVPFLRGRRGEQRRQGKQDAGSHPPALRAGSGRGGGAAGPPGT